MPDKTPVPPGGARSLHDPSAGVPVRLLVLGDRLRCLREAAGATPEQAGARAGVTKSRIERAERGRSVLSISAVEILLGFYKADDAERTAVMKMAGGPGAVPGWWLAYDDTLPGWVEPYFGLEAAASRAVFWEMQFLPGLLQTEEYARAVIRLGAARNAEDVARRTEARVARRGVLERENPPRVEAFVDESVLRRATGDTDVMRGQLRQLLSACENPAVSLRAVPFSSCWTGMATSFSLLQFGGGAPDMVYIEQLTSAVYLDGAEDIAEYHRAARELDEHALPEDGTVSLIRSILDRL